MTATESTWRTVKHQNPNGHDHMIRVHDDATIGEGCTIGAEVRIGPGVKIGNGCQIGLGVHISDGAKIGSNVTIGEHTHIRYKATVGAGCQIGQSVTIMPTAVVPPHWFIPRGYESIPVCLMAYQCCYPAPDCSRRRYPSSSSRVGVNPFHGV